MQSKKKLEGVQKREKKKKKGRRINKIEILFSPNRRQVGKGKKFKKKKGARGERERGKKGGGGERMGIFGGRQRGGQRRGTRARSFLVVRRGERGGKGRKPERRRGQGEGRGKRKKGGEKRFCLVLAASRGGRRKSQKGQDTGKKEGGESFQIRNLSHFRER